MRRGWMVSFEMRWGSIFYSGKELRGGRVQQEEWLVVILSPSLKNRLM